MSLVPFPEHLEGRLNRLREVAPEREADALEPIPSNVQFDPVLPPPSLTDTPIELLKNVEVLPPPPPPPPLGAPVGAPVGDLPPPPPICRANNMTYKTIEELECAKIIKDYKKINQVIHPNMAGNAKCQEESKVKSQRLDSKKDICEKHKARIQLTSASELATEAEAAATEADIAATEADAAATEAQAIASVDKARAAVDKTTEKSIEVRRILDEFPTNEYIEKDIKQKVENANNEANEADITAKNALLEAEAAINIANRKKTDVEKTDAMRRADIRVTNTEKRNENAEKRLNNALQAKAKADSELISARKETNESEGVIRRELLIAEAAYAAAALEADINKKSIEKSREAEARQKIAKAETAHAREIEAEEEVRRTQQAVDTAQFAKNTANILVESCKNARQILEAVGEASSAVGEASAEAVGEIPVEEAIKQESDIKTIVSGLLRLFKKPSAEAREKVEVPLKEKAIKQESNINTIVSGVLGLFKKPAEGAREKIEAPLKEKAIKQESNINTIVSGVLGLFKKPAEGAREKIEAPLKEKAIKQESNINTIVSGVLGLFNKKSLIESNKKGESNKKSEKAEINETIKLISNVILKLFERPKEPQEPKIKPQKTVIEYSPDDTGKECLTHLEPNLHDVYEPIGTYIDEEMKKGVCMYKLKDSKNSGNKEKTIKRIYDLP